MSTGLVTGKKLFIVLPRSGFLVFYCASVNISVFSLQSFMFCAEKMQHDSLYWSEMTRQQLWSQLSFLRMKYFSPPLFIVLQPPHPFIQNVLQYIFSLSPLWLFPYFTLGLMVQLWGRLSCSSFTSALACWATIGQTNYRLSAHIILLRNIQWTILV